ncbi:hypothetical protein [Lacimicrobium alkaliphilum]|uniref:Uncharacterized protein n=1 Tax=Lacimicrobium alkaliphilum TaxID=1526571 RepID=A0A0U2JJS6_9ALTE|nr:hypothetical protein [Lacimicrobium alkaliphilum]ALT00039.1 hypothetical protein AT746_18365 [Lacimicrobium alkaliphilum]
MKGLLDRKSGFISSLFVITFSLGAPVQADNRSINSVPAQQTAGVDATAMDVLTSMGLQQGPADAEQAMQRWQAVLVNIGRLQKDQVVSDAMLAESLNNMQQLADHIVVNKNHILALHTKGELSADSQHFLKYLTSHMLSEQQLSDRHVGDSRYFSRRLNTSRSGEKYRQVTLYKPMRDLISFWQQSPQLEGDALQGDMLSVQQVRKMLERGELDETLIATYSLEKAHLVAKQKALYANQ